MSDVVDLIKQDHREFERMLTQMANQPETRSTVLPVFTALLTAHSRAEELEVYPAVIAAGGADVVSHSQEEHVEADELLARLAACEESDDEFAPLLAEVTESVTHHLEEEEETVLPFMRKRMDARQLGFLGEKFLASREEHLGAGPDDITKAEIAQQATNMDMDGVSGLSKDELQAEVRREAGS